MQHKVRRIAGSRQLSTSTRRVQGKATESGRIPQESEIVRNWPKETKKAKEVNGEQTGKYSGFLFSPSFVSFGYQTSNALDPIKSHALPNHE
jgi:hypothetical protein